MLKADKTKLRLLQILEQEGEMTFGQLRKKAKIAHHYTLIHALDFLQKIGLIEITDKGDNLGSKVVRVTKKNNFLSTK